MCVAHQVYGDGTMFVPCGAGPLRLIVRAIIDYDFVFLVTS